MASLFYRLTYSALTASLLAAPIAGRAQQAISAQPLGPATGAAATTSAPAASSPRPLDDDRYAPAAQGVNAAAPVNGPPPGAASPVSSASPLTAPQSETPVGTPLPPVTASPTPAPIAAPATTTPAQARVRRAPTRPATEVKLSVQGKVEDDADQIRTIKVGQGDTVNVIAERLHTPKDALIKANRLKKPYDLDVGQDLKIPTSRVYLIQTGDTLMGLSRRFGVSPAVLGELNDFDIRDRLHAGQKIALPNGAHDNGPLRTTVPAPAQEKEAVARETRASEPAARAVEPAPQPAAPVQTEPTAAPAPAESSAAEPSHPIPYQQTPPIHPSAASQEPAAAPLRAEPQPEVRLSVQGRVVEDRQKSREMRAGAGDTVNVIADRLLTPKEDLIKLNRLRKPYALDRGEILKIPTPKAYVVDGGDTLAEVSRRFGVSVSALAEINDMDTDERLHAGQKIALPTDVHDSGPIRTVIAGAPQRPAHRYEMGGGEAQPSTGGYSAGGYSGGGAGYYGHAMPPSRLAPPPAYSGPPVDVTPTPGDAEIAAAGRGRFIWPLAGQLISGYGPKPGGQRNDGIDLGAPQGAPVMASGEGDVVYAGNLAEFGVLVLIRDDAGWVTAYAHLSRAEVKIKDHVRRGDEIGEVGQTGGVTQPELHFEIRYAPTPRDKARPIDPMLVLPSR